MSDTEAQTTMYTGILPDWYEAAADRLTELGWVNIGGAAPINEEHGDCLYGVVGVAIWFRSQVCADGKTRTDSLSFCATSDAPVTVEDVEARELQFQQSCVRAAEMLANLRSLGNGGDKP